MSEQQQMRIPSFNEQMWNPDTLSQHMCMKSTHNYTYNCYGPEKDRLSYGFTEKTFVIVRCVSSCFFRLRNL